MILHLGINTVEWVLLTTYLLTILTVEWVLLITYLLMILTTSVKMTLRLPARPRRALAIHSAGTRVTLGGQFHFIWDTQESLVFHFNYTCYPLFPIRFTRLSLVDHLVSKVSSECFKVDLSVLFGFQQRLYSFWSCCFHFNASPFPPWTLPRNCLVIFLLAPLFYSSLRDQ